MGGTGWAGLGSLWVCEPFPGRARGKVGTIDGSLPGVVHGSVPLTGRGDPSSCRAVSGSQMHMQTVSCATGALRISVLRHMLFVVWHTFH